MSNMLEIERLTKQYSERRGDLAERVRALEHRIAAVKDQHLPAIKGALGKTKEAEARLRAAIEESPELFSRPKTQVFHGVKMGYQKSKGIISWEDSALVCKLIHKHFEKNAELFIRITETPNKQALSELPAGELKKIGVMIEETGDCIVIKPVDSEVDRIVNALLKEETEVKEVA